jgi:hypothetical protein
MNVSQPLTFFRATPVSTSQKCSSSAAAATFSWVKRTPFSFAPGRKCSASTSPGAPSNSSAFATRPPLEQPASSGIRA